MRFQDGKTIRILPIIQENRLHYRNYNFNKLQILCN